MSKKKKIIIIISIVALIIGTLYFCVYYFFLPKRYTFYIKENIGTVEVVEVKYDDIKYGTWIYNKDIAKEFIDELENVKAWPYYSTNMKNTNKSFSIRFMGEENKYVSISAEDYGDFYVANFGVEHNGKFIEEPIWDFIGRFCISKEDGDRLYEMTKKTYDENAREISVDELLMFSKEKETDWRKFQQFLYEDTQIEEIVIKNALECESPVKFNIKDKLGYILVWYDDLTVYDENENVAEKYDEILKIIIYNDKGECIDFYDENVESFMEEMN